MISLKASSDSIGQPPASMIQEVPISEILVDNNDYNSPKFLKTSQMSLKTSPSKEDCTLVDSADKVHQQQVESPQMAYVHAISNRSSTGVSPRLVGFSITRSTSHPAFLNEGGSSPHHPVPTGSDPPHHLSPKRIIRSERAKSSPPPLHHATGNLEYFSSPNLSAIHSLNNSNHSNNKFSLVPLSPSNLIPCLEEATITTEKADTSPTRTRSRSNSKTNVPLPPLFNTRPPSPLGTPANCISASTSELQTPVSRPINISSIGHSLTGIVTPTTPMYSPSKQVSIEDFTLIEKIGEGGFGQVFLAKKNDTNEVVALKRMSKDLIWAKNKVTHIKNERDILAQGRNHRWIVSLVYSFQDDQSLYLAMEYVPGGDLRSLLSALNCLEEDSAKFYMAEMVEAVDSCHRLGYCHRDLKPENFLIDRTGHIKLADFGLSKNVVTRYVKAKGTPGVLEHTPMKFGAHALSTSITDFSGFGSFKDLNMQARLAYSVVGSPFYMAPEVLQATTGYGDEVDWWSLGCMFYEFVVGIPPFDGDSPEEVMETVLKWKTNLSRPENISDELWDLISGSAMVYTNKNSGGIVTSRTKPNRNILGFTYPRAGDDPLIWGNGQDEDEEEDEQQLADNKEEEEDQMVVDIKLEDNNNNRNLLKTSATLLNTPPQSSLQLTPEPSPSDGMSSLPDPVSPYGSYSQPLFIVTP
eukprot:gene20050-24042_t